MLHHLDLQCSCLIDDPLRLDTYLMPVRREAAEVMDSQGFSASHMNVGYKHEQKKSREAVWKEMRSMDTPG